MTIRTFWTILIKILGIWLLINCVTVIPQFIANLFIPRSGDVEFVENLGILLMVVGVYIYILRLFIFKSSWLIDKLHLDRGFTEEKFDTKINSSAVLTIATIVIGGVLFADSLPQLCHQIFALLKQKGVLGESPDSSWIIYYLVKTILGYWLMTNSRSVVTFIVKQSANKIEGESGEV